MYVALAMTCLTVLAASFSDISAMYVTLAMTYLTVFAAAFF
jgi:hypothetical protein